MTHTPHWARSSTHHRTSASGRARADGSVAAAGPFTDGTADIDKLLRTRRSPSTSSCAPETAAKAPTILHETRSMRCRAPPAGDTPHRLERPNVCTERRPRSSPPAHRSIRHVGCNSASNHVPRRVARQQLPAIRPRRTNPSPAVLGLGCSATAHVLAPVWRYDLGVPSIQVKDVPDDVHATLRRRAAAAGQSLQEYLLARLVDDTSTPTVDEVLARAGGRAGGRADLADAVRAVRRDRDGR